MAEILDALEEFPKTTLERMASWFTSRNKAVPPSLSAALESVSKTAD